ncbi:ribosomal protein L10 [Opisthorchis viverrini]|uniref:60S acidic ribosomal protein P0 n=1 Tax=Opisthorchis viverrini TaxID=6198 RepID=A0A1S8WIK7_OPIVI|nr:ribosomal protein L10 [Opisthorchis viverrini]
MVRKSRSEWKADYFKKLSKHLGDCDKCFVVNVDNVRSKQMQQIRVALRGSAEIVMGKNTLMKKVIHAQMARNPHLEKILPHVRENVGFIFTKADLLEIREKLEANRVEAPAKAGTIAPCDVIVPAQNTGLGPEKTSFFQALNIPTKIARGSIEILNDIPIITKNTKVGMSEATLLNMLKIYPFTYGLVITQVYDHGSVYDPAVLDITPTMVMEKFMVGVQNIVALGLATGHTTFATVPQVLVNGFMDMLAISVMVDYTFKESEQVKEYLADPSKFVAAITATTPQTASGTPSTVQEKQAAPAAAPPAEESESDSDMGMGLFD